MTEPVACCLHGIDLCEIRPGDAVAVIGGGMIGLIMVQLARLSGASRVALIEPVAAKREMGERLGASLALDPFACDVPAALAAAGFGRLSAVIECAGLPATVRQAIEIAGKRAVVMLFGLTKPDDEVAIRPFALFQREIAIKTSYINPFTQGRALALIASGRVDVQSMVAARLPLEALPDVLADPQRRAQGKVIIHPWGGLPVTRGSAQENTPPPCREGGACPCPRRCPRHGDCTACRAQHAGKKRPVHCERDKSNKE